MNELRELIDSGKANHADLHANGELEGIVLKLTEDKQGTRHSFRQAVALGILKKNKEEK